MGDLAALDQLRAENAEVTNHLQRMAADFDNFRKRAKRDVEQAARFANDKLVGELLAVLDDLERALEHAGDAGESFVEGVKMTHSRLERVLTEHGLEGVDCSGEFDPQLHEALMMQPGSGRPEGTVLQVVQKGYRIGERVVRHAKVIVAG
jgi:molecular chaperone GrpE